MSDRETVDPGSAVPLYHQIAEYIRARIESGELAPGQALEPLRRAAERWSVNLQTVRHAYAALAREGLVDIARGPAGTRVAARTSGNGPRAPKVSDATSVDPALGTFIDRIARDARSRFGVGAAELADLLRDRGEDRGPWSPPIIYAVECSEWQSVAHAREIAARYDVDARPWPLAAGEPPPGLVIATYFHYNDIRRAWPRRFGTVRFITTRPDPLLCSRLEGIDGDALVCERDFPTAEAVIGDLEAIAGGSGVRFVAQVAADPERELAKHKRRPVLFPPRIWAQLGERSRRDPRAIEIVYRLDAQELGAVATALGWRPAAVSRAS